MGFGGCDGGHLLAHRNQHHLNALVLGKAALGIVGVNILSLIRRLVGGGPLTSPFNSVRQYESHRIYSLR